MLWFKKQPNGSQGNQGSDEVVAPVTLAVALDERVFASKFAVLLELVSESGGVDPYVEALGTKSRFYQSLLNVPAISELNLEKIELLLETVMSARKRVWPALEAMGEAAIVQAVKDLLYGKGELEGRLNAFVDLIPEDVQADKKTNKKLKRAAHDFAAELLHFRSPEQYPLMTRWVWDQSMLSGAMRELLKGGDSLQDIPLGTSPGVYEAGRAWIAEQMAAQGVYREPHFLVDLFLAHAYADYMRAMSSGMGLMNADFGGKADPMEVVKKLLGIDETRRGGESRVRKTGV
jgi:hypothetical protein